MTPTELRKQLVKSLSTAQVESVDNNGEAVIEHEADRLLQLITADRKRVALEARIDEINYLDDNFQADSQDWEREHPGYSTAMIPMEDYIRRRTELKQELEKL